MGGCSSSQGVEKGSRKVYDATIRSKVENGSVTSGHDHEVVEKQQGRKSSPRTSNSDHVQSSVKSRKLSKQRRPKGRMVKKLKKPKKINFADDISFTRKLAIHCQAILYTDLFEEGLHYRTVPSFIVPLSSMLNCFNVDYEQLVCVLLNASRTLNAVVLFDYRENQKYTVSSCSFDIVSKTPLMRLELFSDRDGSATQNAIPPRAQFATDLDRITFHILGTWLLRYTNGHFNEFSTNILEFCKQLTKKIKLNQMSQSYHELLHTIRKVHNTTSKQTLKYKSPRIESKKYTIANLASDKNQTLIECEASSASSCFAISESGVVSLQYNGNSASSIGVHGEPVYSDDVIPLGFLGQGACAKVHKGIHVPTLKVVALKSISMSDESNAKQLKHEMETVFHVSNLYNNEIQFPDGNTSCDAADHLVVPLSAHVSLHDSNKVSLVLEYMGVGTLQHVIDTGRSLPESTVATIARDMLHGLYVLHTAGILHRDLKPSNVLVDQQGMCKLSDFGITSYLGSSNEIKSGTGGEFIGTLAFMSPERLQNMPYGFASDVWSFALSIVCCLTGKRLFPPNAKYWDMLDAVGGYIKSSGEEVLGKLLKGRSVTSSCFDFLKVCVHGDPAKRASVEQLLVHPFLTKSTSSRKGLVSCKSNASELKLIPQLVLRHLLGISSAQQCSNEVSPSMAARKVLNEFRVRQSGDDITLSAKKQRPSSLVRKSGEVDSNNLGVSTTLRGTKRSKFTSDIMQSLRSWTHRGSSHSSTSLKVYNASQHDTIEDESNNPSSEVLCIPKENLDRLASCVGEKSTILEQMFHETALGFGCSLEIHDGSSHAYELSQSKLEALLESSDELADDWPDKHQQLVQAGFVFLGGSCGSTEWRRMFMTVLREGGVMFFNPQKVEYVYDTHAPIEKRAKQTCRTLLYVIESCTRASGAMVEAAAALGSGRETIFAVAYPDPEMKINGNPVEEADLNEILNARLTLLNMIWAASHVELLQVETEQAIQYLISKDITNNLSAQSQFASPLSPEYGIYIGGPVSGDGSGDLLSTTKSIALKHCERTSTKVTWAEQSNDDENSTFTEDLDNALDLMHKSKVLLFVVPDDARAYSLLTQAAVYGSAGRQMVIVFAHTVDGNNIASLSDERELNDLLRARGFFQQEMSRHVELGKVFFYDTDRVEDAVNKAIQLAQSSPAKIPKKRPSSKSNGFHYGAGDASRAMVAAVQGTVQKSETAVRLIKTVSRQVMKRSALTSTAKNHREQQRRSRKKSEEAANLAATAVHNAISTDRRASLGESRLERKQREAMNAFAKKVSNRQGKTIQCAMM